MLMEGSSFQNQCKWTCLIFSEVGELAPQCLHWPLRRGPPYPSLIDRKRVAARQFLFGTGDLHFLQRLGQSAGKEIKRLAAIWIVTGKTVPIGLKSAEEG
jgi:hypothetical protein